jgi:DNA invertase Pin-like site-specific DNA recombinase
MAGKRNRVKAVGYVRTSSATNVGADKDSERRQRHAIERFAKSAGYEIIAAQEHTTGSGKPHVASAIQKMLGR